MDVAEKESSMPFKPLMSQGIQVLQVNIGYKCNMACKHCHIKAGPGRHEEMDKETVELVLKVLRENDIGTIDITGGAPEF